MLSRVNNIVIELFIVTFKVSIVCRYMHEVPSCSYRTRTSLLRWDGNGVHSFPVEVSILIKPNLNIVLDVNCLVVPSIDLITVTI